MIKRIDFVPFNRLDNKIVLSAIVILFTTPIVYLNMVENVHSEKNTVLNVV